MESDFAGLQVGGVLDQTGCAAVDTADRRVRIRDGFRPGIGRVEGKTPAGVMAKRHDHGVEACMADVLNVGWRRKITVLRKGPERLTHRTVEAGCTVR